jgi:hypothetical protein
MSSGAPAAAMPTTMALSPESTTLMKTTCRIVVSSDENSMVEAFLRLLGQPLPAARR